MTARLLLFSLLWLLPAASIGRLGDDAGEIVSKIQKKYGSLHDLSVNFTENVRFGVTKTEQNFKGKLLMKRGNHYRIDMEQQTIVTDGKSVWSYNKVNNQLFIDTYKDDPRSFSPDKVLVNIAGNYSATVLGKENLGGVETTIVKLAPKESKASLKWMKVWVDPDEMIMKQVQVLDLSENLMTYRIEKVEINKGIPDEEFSYEAPPPDASIIDLR